MRAEISSNNKFELRNSSLRITAVHVAMRPAGIELTSKQMQSYVNHPLSSYCEVWEWIDRSIPPLLSVISKEQTLRDESSHTYLVEVQIILSNCPISTLDSKSQS